MYCYKQICVKYLKVIHTSSVKQKEAAIYSQLSLAKKR